jgi:hypothetical protein
MTAGVRPRGPEYPDPLLWPEAARHPQRSQWSLQKFRQGEEKEEKFGYRDGKNLKNLGKGELGERRNLDNREGSNLEDREGSNSEYREGINLENREGNI